MVFYFMYLYIISCPLCFFVVVVISNDVPFILNYCNAISQFVIIHIT